MPGPDSANDHTADPAVDRYGIKITRDGDDVTATMTVTETMVNSHGVCHGGLLFLLADAVMDYTTNGPLDDGSIAFAGHAEIDYAQAARIGDNLTAMGDRVDGWGRTNLIDVLITNQRDEPVAHFRGRTRTVPVRPTKEA